MPGKIYYETRVPEIYGSTISLCVLATISLILRFQARRLCRTKLWWDDWTILVAMVCDWGLGISLWLEVDIGLGRHMITYGGPITLEALVTRAKLALATQLTYFTCAAAIKTSLILLYYRLFGIVRQYTHVLLGALIVVLLYGFVNLIVAIFQCHPVTFYWDKSIKGGSCIDQTSYYRWSGVANLLIDFLILLLPLPMIWRLHLSTRQKISLSALFLMGILTRFAEFDTNLIRNRACIASIIRVTSWGEDNKDDVTYTVVHPLIWTSLEQSLGIICACLSTLRPLISHIPPSLTNFFQKATASIAKVKHDSKSKVKRSTISLSTLRSKTTDLTKDSRGPQLSRPGEEASHSSLGGFQRLDDEEHMSFPLYKNNITTDAGKVSDPDLEALGANSRSVIVKRQSIEQYSSGSSSMAAGRNTAAISL